MSKTKTNINNLELPKTVIPTGVHVGNASMESTTVCGGSKEGSP